MVKDKAQKTIYIKWVRSGIAFPRHQKTMVRSLGLGRLNQVVERPDTPQIRGLVESMPHLVKVVSAPEKSAWMAVPEYTIFPPEPSAAPAPRRARVVREEPEEAAAESAGRAEKAAAEARHEKAEAKAKAEHAPKSKKAAKAAAEKTKAGKASEAKKSKAAKAKPAKKTKK
jgi:large subunit ribosomal protein L30